MAKSDLQDSVKNKVVEMANMLQVVREDLKKQNNYERTLTARIIEYCEIYGIENGDIDEFDINIVSEQRNVPLKDILDVFPNFEIKDILENIVAEINIDKAKTEENLRFSGGFQDPIINSIMKQLDKATNTSVKEVKLK
jgi:hypothetical protein